MEGDEGKRKERGWMEPMRGREDCRERAGMGPGKSMGSGQMRGTCVQLLEGGTEAGVGEPRTSRPSLQAKEPFFLLCLCAVVLGREVAAKWWRELI